jgi:hypothetical protein
VFRWHVFGGDRNRNSVQRVTSTVVLEAVGTAQCIYWSLYCLSKEEEGKLESEYTREQDSLTNRLHIFTLNRELEIFTPFRIVCVPNQGGGGQQTPLYSNKFLGLYFLASAKAPLSVPSLVLRPCGEGVTGRAAFMFIQKNTYL